MAAERVVKFRPPPTVEIEMTPIEPSRPTATNIWSKEQLTR